MAAALRQMRPAPPEGDQGLDDPSHEATLSENGGENSTSRSGGSHTDTVDMTDLERRLQKYIDEKFVQLQRQLDERFEELTKMVLEQLEHVKYACMYVCVTCMCVLEVHGCNDYNVKMFAWCVDSEVVYCIFSDCHGIQTLVQTIDHLSSTAAEAPI